ARLASWNLPPPAWSTALRWWAGTTAAAINTWDSLWPHGHLGWPHHADPAAVFLHLSPCLLLIGLAEAIAAYRQLLTETHPPRPPCPPRTHTPHPQPDPPPDPATTHPPHPSTEAAPDTAPPEDDELLTQARDLDATVRHRTGKPVSIRQLRRELHLGQARATA